MKTSHAGDLGGSLSSNDATTRQTASPFQDRLEAEVRAMTDAELRRQIEAIRGNPKHAGGRARRLAMAESLALAALMAEEARRVRS